MRKLVGLLGSVVLVAAFTHCSTTKSAAQDGGADAASGDSGGTSSNSSAFFYQNVGQTNVVRAGITSDGLAVTSKNFDTYPFLVFGNTKVPGDPVVSRLSSGRWAMLAWSSPDDPRGANIALYHESDCPKIDESKIVAIGPSSANGCQPVRSLLGGKSSQIFAAGSESYMFFNNSSRIALVRLSSGSKGAGELSGICVREQKASALSDLAWGDATIVVESSDLLLSDTAIARRKSGDWVLFVKGISKTSGCTGPGLCELCARGIYRTTSADLLTWTPLERVVEKASVPDAMTAPDGTVWLYHQNFEEACAAQDEKLAQRAKIGAGYEKADGTYVAVGNIQVSGEEFETNTQIHYPTNGNPVPLPTEAARSAYEACLK